MIELNYGTRQRFRYRHNDINITGCSDCLQPALKSVYRLNDAGEIHFYIEPHEKRSDPPIYPYGMRTPACHRLRDRPGGFNLEIPVDNLNLRPGLNKLAIEIIDADSSRHQIKAQFHWDPDPVPLPLDLTDLSQYQNIQDIGQVVNGQFEIDPEKNVVRSSQPVGSDILLLLGSPNQDQEATYRIEFSTIGGIYPGLSDFFVGHVAQSDELGIKPGYCTNGLATLNRRGNARIWLSWGDNLMDDDRYWVVSTKNGAKVVSIEANVKYRVRHQVFINGVRNLSRFRIWPEGTEEPKDWLCEENNFSVPEHLPRSHSASFGLFQYFGTPAEWSDIRVSQLRPDVK